MNSAIAYKHDQLLSPVEWLSASGPGTEGNTEIHIVGNRCQGSWETRSSLLRFTALALTSDVREERTEKRKR